MERVELEVKGGKGAKTGGWRDFKPIVDKEKCTGCRICEIHCPDNSIVVDDKTRKAVVDYDYCKGCLICVIECPVKAIRAEETR